MNRYDAHVQRLKEALTAAGGETAVALRRALLEGRVSEAPATLAPYLEKVRRSAWTITDEDVAALGRAGYTEDQIFEVTGSAAVGAALMRVERAMAVVRERAR